MLQEMELHKAIKAHTAGREVLVMFTGLEDGSGQIMVDRLEDYLSGLRFLVEVPATIDPEFAEAVREMENQAPPQDIDGASAGAAVSAKKQTSKGVGAGGKRSKVDTGKMFALRKAGWTQAKIADELGVSEATVCTYLKRGE